MTHNVNPATVRPVLLNAQTTTNLAGVETSAEAGGSSAQTIDTFTRSAPTEATYANFLSGADTLAGVETTAEAGGSNARQTAINQTPTPTVVVGVSLGGLLESLRIQKAMRKALQDTIKALKAEIKDLLKKSGQKATQEVLEKRQQLQSLLNQLSVFDMALSSLRNQIAALRGGTTPTPTPTQIIV